jgi:Ca2+-binding EF-hand superfamily protein
MDGRLPGLNMADRRPGAGPKSLSSLQERRQRSRSRIEPLPGATSVQVQSNSEKSSFSTPPKRFNNYRRHKNSQGGSEHQSESEDEECLRRLSDAPPYGAPSAELAALSPSSEVYGGSSYRGRRTSGMNINNVQRLRRISQSTQNFIASRSLDEGLLTAHREASLAPIVPAAELGNPSRFRARRCSKILADVRQMIKVQTQGIEEDPLVQPAKQGLQDAPAGRRRSYLPDWTAKAKTEVGGLTTELSSIQESKSLSALGNSGYTLEAENSEGGLRRRQRRSSNLSQSPTVGRPKERRTSSSTPSAESAVVRRASYAKQTAAMASMPGYRFKGLFIHQREVINLKSTFDKLDLDKDGKVTLGDVQQSVASGGRARFEADLDTFDVKQLPKSIGHGNPQELNFMDFLKITLSSKTGGQVWTSADNKVLLEMAQSVVVEQKVDIKLQNTLSEQRYAENMAFVNSMWPIWDADGSGELDKEELRVALESMGVDNVDDFDELYAQIDEDDSGFVSKEEFATWWTSNNSQGAELAAKEAEQLMRRR